MTPESPEEAIRRIAGEAARGRGKPSTTSDAPRSAPRAPTRDPAAGPGEVAAAERYAGQLAGRGVRGVICSWVDTGGHQPHQDRPHPAAALGRRVGGRDVAGLRHLPRGRLHRHHRRPRQPGRRSAPLPGSGPADAPGRAAGLGLDAGRPAHPGRRRAPRLHPHAAAASGARGAERGLEFKAAFEIEFALGRDDAPAGEFVPACVGPAYGMTRLVELTDFRADLLRGDGCPGRRRRPGPPRVRRRPVRDLRRRTRPGGSRRPQRARAADGPRGRPAARACACRSPPAWSPGPSATAGTCTCPPGGTGATSTAGATAGTGSRRRPRRSRPGSSPSCRRWPPWPPRARRATCGCVPSHWAGAFACWGHETRETAVRLVTGTVGHRDAAANIEVKCVDLAANPYLLLTSSDRGRLDGVDQHRTLPEEVTGDPARFDDGRAAARGIVRLPRSLGEATEAFAGSALLRAALGPVLHDAVVAVRAGRGRPHRRPRPGGRGRGLPVGVLSGGRAVAEPRLAAGGARRAAARRPPLPRRPARDPDDVTFDAMLTEGGPAPAGQTNFDSPVGWRYAGTAPRCSTSNRTRRPARVPGPAARAGGGRGQPAVPDADAGPRCSASTPASGRTGSRRPASSPGSPAWRRPRARHRPPGDRSARGRGGRGVEPGEFAAAFRDALDRAVREQERDRGQDDRRLPVRARPGPRPADPAEVAAAAARWFARDRGCPGEASWRLDDPVLVRYLLWCRGRAGAAHPVPHRLRRRRHPAVPKVDPTLLTDWLHRHRVPVMLLHCWPFQRQAGYLAGGASARPLRRRARDAQRRPTARRRGAGRGQEVAPFTKLLYSSDAFGLAELYHPRRVRHRAPR